jgi:hypothetical protein
MNIMEGPNSSEVLGYVFELQYKRSAHSIPHFIKLLLGFPNRVLRTQFHPQRLGHFMPLSFTAYGGKIQATRFAGGC